MLKNVTGENEGSLVKVTTLNVLKWNFFIFYTIFYTFCISSRYES